MAIASLDDFIKIDVRNLRKQVTAEKNAAVLDSGALSVWIFSAESTGTHISQFILLEPFDLRFNGFLLVND